MRICVAGAYGAFGIKHLDALAAIDEVTVTSVMGPTQSKIDALATERGIGHASTDLAEYINRDDVDAVILATPTQMHRTGDYLYARGQTCLYRDPDVGFTRRCAAYL